MAKKLRVKRQIDAERGTWDEVIHWLRRRAHYARKIAFRIDSFRLVHHYRMQAEMCESLASKLEVEIQTLLWERLEDWARNPELSAPLTDDGESNDQTP